ncbi:leucine-rich repeats and immunoglobulin-like domains protein 3 [Dinothrombium tinctorium]|uniref:Leucine-rich repeats and immunoglobulin-like domains protein 3 n=1 Tax=Dinothrombium tinctorium TaxID=1965070 RepID=A0A3S3RWG6_9ACAR|nr:leucine-rich repeats and immunoglobulin-like domains protein 3 [Dinothrombium tinctorium]RWS05796.1 leucine-rich repeats and immunoglobulin-like domains protein 3 [Dinothrombium tinctorium]
MGTLMGEKVELNCSVIGNPQPSVTWKLKKIELNNFPMEYNYSENNQILRINNLTSCYAGDYQCEASNSFGGPVVKTFRINCLTKPFSYIYVIFHEEHKRSYIQIRCLFNGEPKPSVKLMKNYVTINASNERHIRFGTIYHFLVKATVRKEIGLYSCHVSNTLGNHSSYLEVIDDVSQTEPMIDVYDSFFLTVFLFTSKSDNYRKALISENIKITIFVQKVEISSDLIVKNISELKKYVFEHRKGDFSFQFFNHISFEIHKFNFQFNAIYNIKAVISNNERFGKFSEWYTYVSIHICGKNVPFITNGVVLISHKKFDGYLNKHSSNFACNTLLSNTFNESICIRRFDSDSITIYDGINENALKINNTAGSDWMCSTQNSLFLKYSSLKEDIGFRLYFTLVSKIAHGSLFQNCYL